MPRSSRNPPDFVDQRRATLYPSIAHPVHGLPVQLLLRLELGKAQVLLGHGFSDGFGTH
jgi:hypothetical protein